MSPERPGTRQGAFAARRMLYERLSWRNIGQTKGRDGQKIMSIKEKKYEEVGLNYRFFARWRQLTFVGNIIVLGAVLTLCISAFKEARAIMWIIPLLASPIGWLLWIIDHRTRDMYSEALRAGKELESSEGGFYSRIIDNVAIPKDQPWWKNLTQTLALCILFIGSSVFLLLISVYMFYKWG